MTKKSNSEWVVTSVMLLGAGQDLKRSGKVQKSPILPWMLCNDPQWQQHDFSVATNLSTHFDERISEIQLSAIDCHC